MCMSKFLNLIESLDPNNVGDPKWELIDFLKSKGINVSPIRDTDMLYIDTGKSSIAITISDNQEDSQESDMVNDIAKDPTNKLSNKAGQVVRKQNQLAPKVINNANKKITELERSLNKPTVTR